MDYSCIKSGYEPLDSIHAVGLGQLLSKVSGQPVNIEDRGLFYALTLTASIHTLDLPDILTELLPMASPPLLEADPNCTERRTWVLDGALCWLFTSPGVRAISVASARRERFHNPTCIEAAIGKWSRLRDRVLLAAQRVRKRSGTSAERVLEGYSTTMPQPVSVGPKPSGGLSVPLMVEPALGYAPYSGPRNLHSQAARVR